MPAYDESKRCKVFGNNTGCPCSIELPKAHHSTNIVYRYKPKKFYEEVDELISKWVSCCDKYLAGPTIGSMVTQNWNPAIKLPYGITAHVQCAFEENGTLHQMYCKFSLVQDEDPLKDYKSVYSKIEGTVEILDEKINVHYIGEPGLWVTYDLPEDAILEVVDGEKVKQFDILYRVHGDVG